MTATEPADHGGLMHRLFDAWNERDIDGFVDCYTDPLVVRTGEGQEDLEVTRVEHQEAARTWWQRQMGRATQINHGHSRSTTITRKPGVTRDDGYGC